MTAKVVPAFAPAADKAGEGKVVGDNPEVGLVVDSPEVALVVDNPEADLEVDNPEVALVVGNPEVGLVVGNPEADPEVDNPAVALVGDSPEVAPVADNLAEEAEAVAPADSLAAAGEEAGLEAEEADWPMVAEVADLGPTPCGRSQSEARQQSHPRQVFASSSPSVAHPRDLPKQKPKNERSFNRARRRPIEPCAESRRAQLG